MTSNTFIRESSIFFSDIVGYSSMIARNEKAALDLLDEHDLILKAHIKDNEGTIIKHIGDSIFAEFSNPHSAISTSIAIQKELNNRNKNATGKKQIVVRIGLHHGNVVVKDNDLFGNDVNLCSRIESISIPGGIASSKNFIDKLDISKLFTRSYGSVKLKNIPDTTEVFRVYTDKNNYLEERQEDLIDTLINRGVKIMQPGKSIDTYRTIAILYPENLGNEDQEFFCYGFLEQIIGDLKKVDQIRTPPIHLIEKYRKTTKSVSDISVDLVAQNIVQLSILSIKDKFKVNVILISMDTGEDKLIESWEGNHNQLKQISGEIIARFTDILSIKLPDEIKDLFKSKNQVNNDAYKNYLKGNYLIKTIKDHKSLDKSEEFLKKAIALDNNFAEAHAALGYKKNLMGEYEEAEEEFEKALAISKNNNNQESLSHIYIHLGIYYRGQKRFEKAINFFQNGLKLQKLLHNEYNQANLLHNMSSCYALVGNNEKRLNLLNQSQEIYDKLEETIYLGNSYGEMGNVYKSIGDNENAIEHYEKAKRIFISEKMNFNYSQALILQADIYIDLKKYNEAKNNLQQAEIIATDFDNPQMNGRIYLAFGAMYAEQDMIEESLESYEEALDIFMDINEVLRSTEIHTLMGLLYLENKQLKKAEKSYKRANKLIKRIKINQNIPIDKLKEGIENYNKS